MSKKKRPYAGSKADPAKAQRRIREMLRGFGVDRIAFDEDFLETKITVAFKYNNYPVCLPVDYGKLAELYLEDDPWTSVKRTSEEDWIKTHQEFAYRATFSLLEDFIKSLITIVELDIFTFEEIFFAYFINNEGERLGEVLVERLPELIAGKLALTSGKR